MKVEMKFVELKIPLFLEGVNHGVKLPKVSGTTLFYDKEDKMLEVHFKGMVALVPKESNIGTMVPKDPTPYLIHTHVQSYTHVHQDAQSVAPIKVDRRFKSNAQVSTPTSHVFEQPK